MRMLIQAWRRGQPQGQQCISAANRSIGFLEEAAAYLPTCKAPAWTLAEPHKNMTIAHAMWEAARSAAAPDLTPMAAVAGAIADAVADELRRQAMTKIIVNNGGDIAVRLEDSESIRVAIRPHVDSAHVSHTIDLTDAMSIGGVCTSGLGGRSFTRGIASAVTAFAHRASVADAAATAIANAANIESPSIQRAPASSIDPNSDLNDLLVTTHVGPLTEREIRLALDQALSYAEQLVKKGTISGAVITVQEHTVWTHSMSHVMR
uniref:UPF0280 family protein n=1 Tax=Desulfomonile tiedjei TaxID=2358 RepID=A0A7C4ASK3_9BACT